MNIKRGGVYLAALDPVIGNEISKTRPAVVISNDKNNEFSGTVTVIPITSERLKKIYPFETLINKGTGNLPKDSKAKADQIRTLDKKRLVKFIGILEGIELKQIEKAIRIHLALF